MNLYLLTQNENTGYDTYDSLVVIADTEEEARYIVPGAFTPTKRWSNLEPYYQENLFKVNYGPWTHPDNVKVTFLGPCCLALVHKAEATEDFIVCQSFNAG
jgi:hypothetical protein